MKDNHKGSYKYLQEQGKCPIYAYEYDVGVYRVMRGATESVVVFEPHERFKTRREAEKRLEEKPEWQKRRVKVPKATNVMYDDAMPRKQTTLTTEQIKEFLEGNPSPKTLEAVKGFLRAELDRREKAGKLGGKPRKYEGDEKERRRLAAKQYRERKGKREGI